MADDSQVSESKYRVAFELAQRIAHEEAQKERNTPEYWLRLYEASFTVVNHGSAAEALAKLKRK